ncbi:MAG: glucose-1-phosphate adenylyltransferase subunit GlgD [Clostridiales bacterium]|nr:glucose-1-phosphate adenylyltransferase subunit GlgD [Clostridiales bacterium]
MSSALGLIFSNIHDDNMPELTVKRTVASIPFCGRYRLIDFALSNMVNSDIAKVGVITKSNYQSLMDHIGSGKDWDLARHYGGLYILPPFGVLENNSLYTTRLEALKNVIGFLNKSTEDYVVMSDSDMVCNIDFKPIIKRHEETNALITCVYVERQRDTVVGNANAFVKINGDGVITEMSFDSKAKSVNLYTNICVVERRMLINLIADALSHGKMHFLKDLVIPEIKTGRVMAYKHEGYYEEITSLLKYYEESMRFLDRNTREEVFRKANVYTKVKDSAPTRYGDNSVVKNSLVADGCQIEGEVYNSIIFRGVKVGRGTVVKNSILMQNTITGENITLNCVIADKNVVIKDGRTLSGHETHPFFLSKGTVI